MRLSFSARTRFTVLAVAAAVLAGIFAYLYLGGLSDRTPVVVAARDFDARTMLDAGFLKTIYLPAAAVHPAAVRRVADAAGKFSLVARSAGEQILVSSLAGGDRPGDYRAALRPEERALFLPADAVLGRWLGVAPGDCLDLTVVLDQGQAFCLGQGLEVLDVVSEAEESGLLGGRARPVAGILLRVTPSLAERISLGAECGKLFFAIVGYDGVPVPTEGAWLDQLNEGGETAAEPLWP